MCCEEAEEDPDTVNMAACENIEPNDLVHIEDISRKTTIAEILNIVSKRIHELAHQQDPWIFVQPRKKVRCNVAHAATFPETSRAYYAIDATLLCIKVVILPNSRSCKCPWSISFTSTRQSEIYIIVMGRQQQVQAYDNGDYIGCPRCGALYRGAALGCITD